MKTAIAIIALAGLTGAASAQTDYFGAGGSFPDNGGPSNQFSSSIVIADAGNVADINVTLNGAAHTWVGDLIVTLSNGSTSVELINRPGEPDDSTVGWSWNLNGDYTWDDDGASSFEDVGNLNDSLFDLPSGTYSPENALSAFNGDALAGTWTLTISDNALFDTGGIQGWTLTATVPAPTSMALLGLGGLVAGRRRR